MAPFTKTEVDTQRLDWVILRDGGIALYLRGEFLNEDIEELTSYSYQCLSFDCADWNSDELMMHEAFAAAFSFPSYYGRNFNALDECMAEDLEITKTGMVVVLRNCERFYPADKIRHKHCFEHIC